MAYTELKTKQREYQCLYTMGHQTTDLYLNYCGIEICSPDHSYGPFAREEYLIHFITGGHGYFQINNKEYELFPNQAFLIPPHIPVYYHADPSMPYSYAWIGFDGKKVSSYLKQTELSIHHPVCDLNIPVEEFCLLIRHMLTLRSLNISSDIERVGYLYRILSLLIASSQSSPSGKTPLNYSTETYVEYAIQYVKQHYNHITVSDIVNYIGINRSYLHSVFKEKLQMSPQEYLISYRLGIAKELLDETRLSITDIAFQTGYHDALSFSKAFKKKYGLSPTLYRKSAHNKGGIIHNA